jgi:hypothetical protein
MEALEVKVMAVMVLFFFGLRVGLGVAFFIFELG